MIDELLTVRRLQSLLHMDRTTIYRMLQEDRLPGFKVGGQWRFSRAEIDRWLAGQQANRLDEAPSTPDGCSNGPDVLPLHCVQPIQNVFAEAMDVGAVTTAPDGSPFTVMSNPSALCALLNGTEEGRRRCSASWRALAAQAGLQPALARCHAGLGYARGQVSVGGKAVAMVFAGQFLSEDGALDDRALRELAAACGLGEDETATAAGASPRLTPAQAGKALRLLQVVAETFSTVGEERRGLMDRLKRISEMSAI